MTRAITPGYARGVLLVVDHLWTWYRSNWRATAVSSVLQPLLFLLAFGVGFGSLLAGRPVEGGVPYLVWLAPALLAVSAMQGAVFESTYPVLSGFKWQRVYHAMTAGPIRPGQVAVAHVTWVGLKVTVTGSVYIAVIAVFGGVTGPGIVLSLVAAVLTAVATAAAVTAFAATVENESSAFNALYRFMVIPMTLFSGTFFPLSGMPGWVQWLAWISPLWHGTELARAAALGRWEPLAALAHVAFLGALLAVGLVLATRFFTRRLTP